MNANDMTESNDDLFAVWMLASKRCEFDVVSKPWNAGPHPEPKLPTQCDSQPRPRSPPTAPTVGGFRAPQDVGAMASLHFDAQCYMSALLTDFRVS
jgi:hypothetical protein